MRSTILALIGAFSHNARARVWCQHKLRPLCRTIVTQNATAAIKVAAGCGWGFHPIPGHWNEWREE
jgi:hypothetical protein